MLRISFAPPVTSPDVSGFGVVLRLAPSCSEPGERLVRCTLSQRCAAQLRNRPRGKLQLQTSTRSAEPRRQGVVDRAECDAGHSKGWGPGWRARKPRPRLNSPHGVIELVLHLEHEADPAGTTGNISVSSMPTELVSAAPLPTLAGCPATSPKPSGTSSPWTDSPRSWRPSRKSTARSRSRRSKPGIRRSGTRGPERGTRRGTHMPDSHRAEAERLLVRAVEEEARRSGGRTDTGALLSRGAGRARHHGRRRGRGVHRVHAGAGLGGGGRPAAGGALQQGDARNAAAGDGRCRGRRVRRGSGAGRRYGRRSARARPSRWPARRRPWRR
ncbi:hypothetical protein SMICM304S_00102 [Streptomyces microflavus]